MIALASAVLLGWSVVLWTSTGRPADRIVALSAENRPLEDPRPTAFRRHLARWLPAALLLLLLATWRDAGAHIGALAGIAALSSGASARLTLAARRRRLADRRRLVVVAWCDALAAELRGGLTPERALRRACRHDVEFLPVLRAAELGADVAAAMRRCGGTPGLEALGLVAAGWQVAAGSGSGLADVLDRLADGLRADADARTEVQAALGPPRATARMLAVLPVFGLLLGSSMGANPLAFLLQTEWGLGCLAIGVGLALLGVWWVDRIASAAEA